MSEKFFDALKDASDRMSGMVSDYSDTNVPEDVMVEASLLLETFLTIDGTLPDLPKDVIDVCFNSASIVFQFERLKNRMLSEGSVSEVVCNNVEKCCEDVRKSIVLMIAKIINELRSN